MPIIYLSPSQQPYNLYVNGGNEQQHMNQIADEMQPLLRANGIQYTRNPLGSTLGKAIRESNAGYYDLHLAIHSNSAPPELSGKLRGTDVYYYPTSTRGKKAADVIAKNFKNIYPLPEKVRTVPTTSLAEIKKVNAPSVLIETAYHDNPDDANWIVSNTGKIASNLVQSLTEYFGIPFFPTVRPERKGKVSTPQGGNMNIRSKPSLEARVIGQAPNGAFLKVLNEWNNWYVVDYNGLVGYASADYIDIV